jgi:hypothetical protein
MHCGSPLRGARCVSIYPGSSRCAFFQNLSPLFTVMLSSAFIVAMPRLHHAATFMLNVGGIMLSLWR